MYRGSVSTFADLSVALGATPCYVQMVHFWYLKSAYFLETQWGPPLFEAPGVICDVAVVADVNNTIQERFEWGVKQAPREAPDSEC